MYYNNNFEFKWMDNYLPSKYSSKIKTIAIKISKNWNRTNHFIVVWALILIIIISITTTYYLHLIYNNFDTFVEAYLKYKNLK
jgi:hypothetical protein